MKTELTEGEKKKFEEILKFSKEYAEKNGFKLNPKEDVVRIIIIGLIKNEEKYGKRYCPCRVVTKNAEEDKPKICPCKWHREEIARMGHCLCGLFVSKEYFKKNKH